MSYKKSQTGLACALGDKKKWFSFQKPERQCQWYSPLGDDYANRAAVVQAEEAATGARQGGYSRRTEDVMSIRNLKKITKS